MDINFLDNKINLLLMGALLTALVLIIPSSFLILSIIILLVAFIGYIYNRILISILILSYLAISGQIFEEFRIYVNLLSTVVLLFLFLKEFGLKKNQFAKVPKGVLFFTLFLFFTLSVSTIFSQNFTTSLLAFARTLVLFIISYLFYSLLKDEKNIYTFIYSIIGVLLFLGLPMLIDLYNLGFQGYFIKILLSDQYDLYSSKGYTGYTLLFISITFITIMFFLERFKTRKFRILLSLLLIYNIVVLILANSRGGIVAAMISIIFFFAFLKVKLMLKYLIYGSLVIAFLFIIIPAFNDIVDNYMRVQTVGDREVYWTLGLDIINDYPIFGVGADLFDKYFYTYAPSSTINFFDSEIIQVGKPHPHNFFLYYFAENGLLGLITAVSFFVILFYYCFKTIMLTSGKHKDFYIISVGITGIGVGIFFRSFFEVTGFLTYGYISRDLPFWLIFAILISIYQKFKKPSSRNTDLLTK